MANGFSGGSKLINTPITEAGYLYYKYFALPWLSSSERHHEQNGMICCASISLKQAQGNVPLQVSPLTARLLFLNGPRRPNTGLVFVVSLNNDNDFNASFKEIYPTFKKTI